MTLPPPRRCAGLASLLTLTLLSPLAQAGDELFVGHGATEIMKGATSGYPTGWTTLPAATRTVLRQGDDLLAATENGLLLRLSPETGEVLASHDTGLAILAMSIHDGRLLVSAADNRVHLLDPQTGQALGTLHPNFPVRSLEVKGDRVYSGSADGRIESSLISEDLWTTLVPPAIGAVTDMAFGGDVLYFTRENSSSVFIRNNEDSQNLREFVVHEPPISLAVTGTKLLVGTTLAGIYDYDVPSFFTAGVVWVEHPIISLFVNHTETIGVEFCAGDACPCGNPSSRGGCANSTGNGAHLEATGSSNITFGDVDLRVRDLPQNSFAVLFMSQGAVWTSFGGGRLCVGGQPVFRFPVRETHAQGLLEELGIVQHSRDHFGAAGELAAGSTWHFQTWYRDPQGSCGAGFNTSNAWSIAFTE